MIIRITDGSTTQTLAAGSARAVGEPVGPDGLRISGPVKVQERSRLRAASAKYKSRGNMQTSIAFRSSYEFASVGLAQQFVLLWRATIIREGTVTLQTTGGAVSTISDCVVVDPVCQQYGCTVYVDYQILGGAQAYELPEGIDADGFTMVDADGNTMVFQP